MGRSQTRMRNPRAGDKVVGELCVCVCVRVCVECVLEHLVVRLLDILEVLPEDVNKREMQIRHIP